MADSLHNQLLVPLEYLQNDLQCSPLLQSPLLPDQLLQSRPITQFRDDVALSIVLDNIQAAKNVPVLEHLQRLYFHLEEVGVDLISEGGLIDNFGSYALICL